MVNFVSKIIRKIRILQIVNYINKNLTRDVFLSKKNEVVIFFNNKIYVIRIQDDIIMLSKEDPTTGSAFDYGTLEYLLERIVNDPYKWYHNQTKEFFESLIPRKKKVKKEKEDKSRRKVRE